jgi:Protein of unknown function (DUF3891)
MLPIEYGDKYILLFQNDHADLAGQLAAYWGNERFAQPKPFEEMAYAASVHDMSWIFWDYYPATITDDQKPIPWIEMRKYAFDEFSRFYRVGITGVGPYHEYTQLLLAMHAAGLYKGRYGTQASHLSVTRDSSVLQTVPKWQEDIDQLEKIQEDSKQQLMRSPSTAEWVSEKMLWTNYKLIQVWDRLSQYIMGLDTNIVDSTLHPVPLSYSGEETHLKLQRGSNEKMDQAKKSVLLSPYPFADDPHTFYFKSVVVPNRRYSDQKDLARAILQGKRINFEVKATAAN